jgi:integrase
VGDLDERPRLIRVIRDTRLAAERELFRRLALRTQTPPRRRTPNLSDVCEEWFIRTAARQDWSAGTRIQYGSVVNGLILPTLGSTPVGEITSPMIATWLDKITDNRPGRGKQALTVMMGVLAFAVRAGHISHNPAREVTISVSRRQLNGDDESKRIFTPDEIARLRQAADDWDNGILWTSGPRPDVFARAFVEMGIALGPRLGELLALKWTDISDSGETFLLVSIQRTLVPSRVRESGSSYLVQEHTKNRMDRRVRVSRSILPFLEALPHRGEFVFATKNGTPLTQASVGRRLRPILSYAEISGASFHTFRRTIATAVERELGLDKAAAAIGDHSRAVAAKHYIQVAQEAPDYRSIIANYLGESETR